MIEDSSGDLWFAAAFVVFCLLLSAFFSASETAFTAASRSRMLVLEKGGDRRARLVNRLLDSPHYGERWGRHWLDIAHYADSNGYNQDHPREIWMYRDWVIDALNRDLPFDRFVVEQVAGRVQARGAPRSASSSA